MLLSVIPTGPKRNPGRAIKAGYVNTPKALKPSLFISIPEIWDEVAIQDRANDLAEKALEAWGI